jgi:hypothetical protein
MGIVIVGYDLPHHTLTHPTRYLDCASGILKASVITSWDRRCYISGSLNVQLVSRFRVHHVGTLHNAVFDTVCYDRFHHSGIVLFSQKLGMPYMYRDCRSRITLRPFSCFRSSRQRDIVA